MNNAKLFLFCSPLGAFSSKLFYSKLTNTGKMLLGKYSEAQRILQAIFLSFFLKTQPVSDFCPPDYCCFISCHPFYNTFYLKRINVLKRGSVYPNHNYQSVPDHKGLCSVICINIYPSDQQSHLLVENE